MPATSAGASLAVELAAMDAAPVAETHAVVAVVDAAAVAETHAEAAAAADAAAATETHVAPSTPTDAVNGGTGTGGPAAGPKARAKPGPKATAAKSKAAKPKVAKLKAVKPKDVESTAADMPPPEAAVATSTVAPPTAAVAPSALSLSSWLQPKPAELVAMSQPQLEDSGATMATSTQVDLAAKEHPSATTCRPSFEDPTPWCSTCGSHRLHKNATLVEEGADVEVQ